MVNEAGNLQVLRRVVVVGTTGSGKTTLARRLAGVLGAPHIELDALYWEPGWRPAAVEDFRSRVNAAVAADAWVADGNYHVARDIIWPRATALVWLDLPLTVILARLLRRGLVRSLKRQELWNGNRERLSGLLGPDSLLLWALKTHARHRREYGLALESEFKHLEVIRLRSGREATRWLESLAEAVTRSAGPSDAGSLCGGAKDPR